MDEKKYSPEELLSQGVTVQLKPEGYSMYPLFVPGRDEAVISPVAEGKKLRRGDVVLYRRESGILVLHRIVRVKKEGYYLVGDNQKEIEGPLHREQMKGIMTEIVRKGRHFSVKHPVYRLASGFWLFLRPARPVISKSVARIKRFFRREKA